MIPLYSMMFHSFHSFGCLITAVVAVTAGVQQHQEGPGDRGHAEESADRGQRVQRGETKLHGVERSQGGPGMTRDGGPNKNQASKSRQKQVF